MNLIHQDKSPSIIYYSMYILTNLVYYLEVTNENFIKLIQAFKAYFIDILDILKAYCNEYSLLELTNILIYNISAMLASKKEIQDSIHSFFNEQFFSLYMNIIEEGIVSEHDKQRIEKNTINTLCQIISNTFFSDCYVFNNLDLAIRMQNFLSEKAIEAMPANSALSNPNRELYALLIEALGYLSDKFADDQQYINELYNSEIWNLFFKAKIPSEDSRVLTAEIKLVWCLSCGNRYVVEKLAKRGIFKYLSLQLINHSSLSNDQIVYIFSSLNNLLNPIQETVLNDLITSHLIEYSIIAYDKNVLSKSALKDFLNVCLLLVENLGLPAVAYLNQFSFLSKCVLVELKKKDNTNTVIYISLRIIEYLLTLLQTIDIKNNKVISIMIEENAIETIKDLVGSPFEDIHVLAQRLYDNYLVKLTY
jgi:hypothetical protein